MRLWGRVTGSAVIGCVWQKTTFSQEIPVRLIQAISWLVGNLHQGSLFPLLEESWPTELTEKEQSLVAVLEVVEVEAYVPRSAGTQWF